MVGFLAAGFVLKFLGYETSPTLQSLADLGVTLLLFSIGLKLRLETLLKPQVWASTSLHMVASIVVFGMLVFALSILGVRLFTGVDLATASLIAFALSFSSTVFAIKALEEKRELTSVHGRVAIGVLVMQDILAVIFITASAGKVPSLWALALFGLPLLRPVFYAIMERCGHGELLPLFGLFASLVVGAEAFQLVGLKADLGALVLGVLLSRHPRANEISNSLLAFKDILLIGFFINIGLTGTLSLETFLIAVLLLAFMPLKAGLFFWLLTKLRLRARSALFASLALCTYSEFGLIVGAIGVSLGLLTPDWLSVIAFALALSFVIASPVNTMAQSFYIRFHDVLARFESPNRLPEEMPIDVGQIRIAILGMGRVGAGAYDAMRERYGEIVLGLESDPFKVERHQEGGRRVERADGTDPDFWTRVAPKQFNLVMLTLPDLKANLDVIRQLKESGFEGRIVAAARYADDREKMEKAGVDMAVDVFSEAGSGFADDVINNFNQDLSALRLGRLGDFVEAGSAPKTIPPMQDQNSPSSAPGYAEDSARGGA